jgi:hypothetical protein
LQGALCTPYLIVALSSTQIERKRKKENTNLCAKVQNQLEGKGTGLISDRDPTQSGLNRAGSFVVYEQCSEGVPVVGVRITGYFVSINFEEYSGAFSEGLHVDHAAPQT